MYWPGVVRTARAPDLRGVHPTFGQWHPTLVQYALGDTRATMRAPSATDQGSPFSDKTFGDSHARATRSARVSDVMTPEVLRSHETARVDNFWPVRPDPRGVRSFGPGAGPQVRKRALNPQGSSQRVPDDVAVRSLEV